MFSQIEEIRRKILRLNGRLNEYQNGNICHEQLSVIELLHQELDSALAASGFQAESQSQLEALQKVQTPI